MSRTQFAKLAAEDLDGILDTIAQDKPIAAANFVELIREKCELFATQSGMGELRAEFGRDVRCFPVGNYVIYYRPTPDGIEAARVIHGARDFKPPLK